MRYVSKAEKERQRQQSERQRWMTLVEAINSITSKESCDQREAVDDLFRAIVDNNVKARLGNWSSDPDSLGGFNVASRYDFQGKIKVCLDGPGYIRLDSQPAKIKYPIGDINGYAKVEIVDGPVVDIDFDIEKDVPIPDVNTSDYRPLLVSRDDLQKWPFVSDEESHQDLSAPAQILETADNTRALGSSKRPNLGRPRGSGSWASADEPLLTEMQELIESGKSKSPNDAALKVASRASGDGTIESKSSRLAKRYRDKYKLEQK
jgi:hypothetical protein